MKKNNKAYQLLKHLYSMKNYIYYSTNDEYEGYFYFNIKNCPGVEVQLKSKLGNGVLINVSQSGGKNQKFYIDDYLEIKDVLDEIAQDIFNDNNCHYGSPQELEKFIPVLNLAKSVLRGENLPAHYEIKEYTRAGNKELKDIEIRDKASGRIHVINVGGAKETYDNKTACLLNLIKVSVIADCNNMGLEKSAALELIIPAYDIEQYVLLTDSKNMKSPIIAKEEDTWLNEILSESKKQNNNLSKIISYISLEEQLSSETDQKTKFNKHKL